MTGAGQPRGKSFGRAGMSADHGASWAKNAGTAKTGAAGERRTAALLDSLVVSTDAVVLHDLDVRRGKIHINVDHVVVSGRRVQIIDTKVWKPGFYWTLAGTSRRGWTPVPHLDRKSEELALEILSAQIPQAHFETPLVAVWSSQRDSHPTLWAAHMPGAKVIAAEELKRRMPRFMSQPADASVVASLHRFLPAGV